MRRYGYAVAFVLVLLATLAGAFLAGRFLVRGLRQELGSGQTWTPPELTVTPLPGQPALSPTPAAAGLRPTVSRSPVPPRQAVPTAPPVVTLTPAPQATFTAPASSPTATETPAATVTATPTATSVSAFEFLLARPVRHSTGDCPGSYILGQVTDRSANPLPGTRLWLVDEYGNQATTTTKTGATDAGRYDFPLFGPPRRFFLSVVDAAGQPISLRMEIPHGIAPNAQATCHWVDWQRR
jgi:hypothetical protein